MRVRSCVCLPTSEEVWFCPAHSQYLPPRTPEAHRGVCGGIFPLGMGGVWMMEGEDGQLLRGVGVGKMEEVQLHSADVVLQLQNGAIESGPPS